MDLPPQLSFALYVAAFGLGFPLNTLAIRGTMAHARLHLTPSLVYALYLGCSDLLLVASLPLKVVEALATGAWTLPAPLCPVFALAHFIPLYAGGGFLAALSVGRYLGAAFPLGYQATRRPCYSWGVCVWPYGPLSSVTWGWSLGWRLQEAGWTIPPAPWASTHQSMALQSAWRPGTQPQWALLTSASLSCSSFCH